MRASAFRTVFLIFLVPSTLCAQSFEVFGTRAAGMGGAFVAVADDASAVFWNPAALGSGPYFSLALDRNGSETVLESSLRGSSESAWAIALGTPPLGLTYYRLRATGVTPAGSEAIPGATARVESLITHHAGGTLVQSLTEGIAVGATLKLVRGIAASGLPAGNDVDALLDEADDLVGTASNAFDTDLGVLAVFGRIRAGLSVRNVLQPEFETAGAADPLKLERQTRAGASYTTSEGLRLAADIDLEAVSDAMGDRRTLAVGAESPRLRRVILRSGFRFNTTGGQPGGRGGVGSVGGSYAVLGSILVDGQVSFGRESGWGIAGRVMF